MAESMQGLKRTHRCGELSAVNVGQTQTENRQGQSEKADCPCRIARCKTRVQYGRMRTTNRSL